MSDASPALLRASLIAHAKWKVSFTLAGARKGASRGDAFYVAGCLFSAVGLLVQALHAQAECWVLNEKGAVRAAGNLPLAPPDFAVRARALFGVLGTTLDALGARLDDAENLAGEVWEKLAS